MTTATHAPRTNKAKVRAALGYGPKSALKIALDTGVKIDSVNNILEQFRKNGIASCQNEWYWRATENTRIADLKKGNADGNTRQNENGKSMSMSKAINESFLNNIGHIIILSFIFRTKHLAGR